MQQLSDHWLNESNLPNGFVAPRLFMSSGLAGVVPTRLVQLGKNQQAWTTTKEDTNRS
jgi:hypothetical protein